MSRPPLPKLVITDLDGTLVRDDWSVSERTHAAMRRVREAGIAVVGATGRGPRLTGLSRRHLPSANYFVLGGGGRVLDLTEEAPAVLRDARFPAGSLVELLAAVEAAFGVLPLTVEALDDEEAPLWSESDAWPYPDPIEIRSRSQLLAGLVIKAFLQVEAALGDEVVAVARAAADTDVVEVIQAWPGFIEIHPPDVDKATGCAIVTELLGVDPADVLVFGDQLNDVPAFAWAGRRVAVANAHPELLAMADDVTLSNNADGVAAYLERLF